MNNNSIIFLGDIASPTPGTSLRLDELLTKHKSIFSQKPLIGNLEGLISEEDLTCSHTPILYNDVSIIPVLNKHYFKAVGLANNHTLDKPALFRKTDFMLSKSNIKYAGAGFSKNMASKPVMFHIDGKRIILFNASWHLLQHHQKNPNDGLFVNEIEEKSILKAISDIRERDKEAKIISFFHWSFDLESLPFPMYRSFSRELINQGADLVVGTHSHCPQGGEKYNGKYIIYGLGNFFVPWYTFINGSIHFPDISRTELAFEWDFETDNAVCHWFKYTEEREGHNLELLESKPFPQSNLMKEYSQYSGLSEKEYINYFIRHRRKNKFVPVYKSYKNRITNQMYDQYLKYRMKLLRSLAKSGLREWNN